MQENDSPAASEAAPERSVPSADPAARDWREGLGPEQRRIADKFLSVDDAIRSYGALERRLGRSIVMPDAHADPAEWDAFYDRLGRPAQPSDYVIGLPEDLPAHLRPTEADKARQDGFLAAMHRAGATPAVVEAATAWYFRELMEADRQGSAAIAMAAADAEAALRQEWRGDYDRNLAYARRALAQFGDGELAQTLENSGLTRSPTLLRAFARIGRAVSEDGVSARPVEPDVAHALNEELMTLRQRPDYWSSEQVQKRVREITVALYDRPPAHADI